MVYSNIKREQTSIKVDNNETLELLMPNKAEHNGNHTNKSYLIESELSKRVSRSNDGDAHESSNNQEYYPLAKESSLVQGREDQSDMIEM
jgi:hypothetical protein